MIFFSFHVSPRILNSSHHVSWPHRRWLWDRTAIPIILVVQSGSPIRDPLVKITPMVLALANSVAGSIALRVDASSIWTLVRSYQDIVERTKNPSGSAKKGSRFVILIWTC